jgi:phage gpG-like protein
MKNYGRLLLKRISNDLKVELKNEINRNFERKAFFDKKWQDVKTPNKIGSLMMRSGALRFSIEAEVLGNNTIRFSSSLPYASIHNQGGKIEMQITPKQRKFFWAKHKEAKDAGEPGADMWKALAMKKGTLTITIPQRQFIGDHPEMDEIAKDVIHENVMELIEEWNRDIGVK